MTDAWPEEWHLSIPRDAGVVLHDYLDEAQQTGDWTFPHPSVKAALNELLGALESANDGTCFSRRYAEELAASRQRLSSDPAA